MTYDVLAYFFPGPLEIIVVLLIFGIPVALVVFFIRHLSKGRKENQRLRMEVGKLADELEQARKES